MTIDINEVKRYLRIEYDDEDNIIAIMVDAARETLKEAGADEEKCPDINKYKLAVYMLTAYFYENRGESTANGAGLPAGMSTIIEQLRNTEVE